MGAAPYLAAIPWIELVAVIPQGVIAGGETKKQNRWIELAMQKTI